MSRSVQWFVLPLLLCSFALAGCGTDTEGEPVSLDFNQLIAQGKAELSAGDIRSSHETFLLAQSLHPQNSDAAFGVVLSDVLLMVKLIDGVLEFALDYLSSGETAETGALQMPLTVVDQPGIGDTIHTYLESIFDPVINEIIDNLATCKQDPEFFFDIDRVPIYFMGELRMEWVGPWDSDDLIWLDAINRLLRGLTHVIYSTDLNFDLRHFTAIDFDLEQGGLTGLFDDLIEALYLMFFDPRYPNFFLNTERAAELMPVAGVDFGFFFEDLVEVQHAVQGRRADPDVGVFAFADENGNGVMDPGESFTYNGAPLPPAIEPWLPVANAIFWNIRTSLFDNTEQDDDPGVPNPWNLADLNLVLSQFLGVTIRPIPDTPIDLSAYFLEPDPAPLKATLGKTLYCAHNERGLLDVLSCLLGLW